jgi:hypothetical protein
MEYIALEAAPAMYRGFSVLVPCNVRLIRIVSGQSEYP